MFSKKSQVSIALVCIVKDEFDYLLEWIAYHRAVIGIHHFYIADNVSNDGTTQLLEALDLAGIVTRIHFPRVDDKRGIQADAYNHILKKYHNAHDYFAFIDADEFIVNHTSESLHSIINKLDKNKDFGAFALNWRVFGSSGSYYQTNDLVIDRFRLASRVDHSVNYHIKTILKPEASSGMQIHFSSLKQGYKYYCRSGKCRFIRDLKNKALVGDDEVTAFISELDNHLYVAHYVVKSKYEHMSKKAKRGSAAGPAARQKGEAYFNWHDLNQVWSDDTARFSGLVEEEVLSLKKMLKQKTLFGLPIRFKVDQFNEKLTGWVGISQNVVHRIKLLRDGVEESTHELTIPRPDVFKLGLSDQEMCGFSIDLKGMDKSQLIIWLEGSNTILWHGQNGF